jgi:hypothetical protein
MPVLQASAAGIALQLDLSQQPCSPVPAWEPLLIPGDAESLTVLRGRSDIPVDTDHYIAPGTGGHGRARADALLPVIAAFGCQVVVFGYNATRGDKFLIMTGTRPALDALELLLPSIALQMEQAARRAVNVYNNTVRDELPHISGTGRRRGQVTVYFRDYLRGYGIGAAEKICSLRADTMMAGVAGLAQILACDEMRVSEIFNRDFPDRQPLRPERSAHPGARQEGIDAGRAADLGDGYLASHDLYFATL